MKDQESLPLGIVLERRRIDHPWKDFDWRPVTVIPGAPACDPEGEWRVLGEGEDWIHYHGGTLILELFRRETEGYKVNLSNDPPRVFVVLRSGEDMGGAHDVVPFLITACPYEAQDYLDSGEDIIEGVPMPGVVLDWVHDFVDKHHVAQPFRKRKRERLDPDKVRFSRQGSAGSRGGRRG